MNNSYKHFNLDKLNCVLLLMVFFISHQTLYGEAIQSKNVAICYFGLTRSLKHVYQSHEEMIFSQLKRSNINFDIYIHTWSINAKQRIWDKEIDCPIDYDEYKLLNPKFYRLDSQDEFTDNLDFSNYYYDQEKLKEWIPALILNHLCALESQKRVTEMVENSGTFYDYIIYVRPDVQFFEPINVKTLLKLRDNQIIIPDFCHYAGYNDRFAILTSKTAPIYGKRIDHIVDFRKTQGSITSEKYLKYICDKNCLKVKFIDFTFEIIRPY